MYVFKIKILNVVACVFILHLYYVLLYMLLKQKFIFCYTRSCQTITTLFLDIITTCVPDSGDGEIFPPNLKYSILLCHKYILNFQAFHSTFWFRKFGHIDREGIAWTAEEIIHVCSLFYVNGTS